MNSVISARDAALLARVSRLDFMTAAEAAIYLRVSRATFEQVAKGIPFHRLTGPRGDRSFACADLDAFRASSRFAA